MNQLQATYQRCKQRWSFAMAVAPAWLLGLFLLRTTAAEEAFEDNGVRCQYRQIKDKARRKEDLFRGKRERENIHKYKYINI